VSRLLAEPPQVVNGLDDAPLYPEPEDWGSAQPSPLAHVEYVEDLLRPGRILLVPAVEGTGKSYAVEELAIRVATGNGAFASTWRVLETGPVLVASEMHRDDSLRYRDTVLGGLACSTDALQGRYWHLDLLTAAHGAPALLEPAWRAWVTAWCRAHEVLVLFIDTATTATGGMEAWGEAMVRLFGDLRVMLRELPELALVLACHLRKANGRAARDITSIIGDWAKWCDVVLQLDDEGGDRTRLTTRKRVRRQRVIIARRQDGLLLEPVDVTTGKQPKVAGERVVQTIGDNPGRTVDELATLWGVAKRTADKYLDKAEQRGMVVSVAGTDRYAKKRYFVEEAEA